MTPSIGSNCPEEVLAAIAWYPDDLDDERRGAVEAHAAACPACRSELEFVCGDGRSAVEPPDPERVYAQIRTRIEQHEEMRDAAPAPRPATVRRGRVLFGSRPAALAAGVALALLFGAGGVMVGMSIVRTATPVYETAGAATTNEMLAAPSLDVVFRTDARAEDIHAALQAVGGQIVSGPTDLGVYRVRLDPGVGDVDQATRALRGEGEGVAIFAEPTPR